MFFVDENTRPESGTLALVENHGVTPTDLDIEKKGSTPPCASDMNHSCVCDSPPNKLDLDPDKIKHQPP